MMFATGCASGEGATAKTSSSTTVKESSPQEGSGESRQTESEPGAGPATSRTPVSESASDEPDRKLAEEVVRAAGGERFDKVAQLEFRFLVDSDGEKLFEAWHRWDRAAMRDRVQWSSQQGEVLDVMVDLDTKTGWAFVDEREVHGDRKQELLDQAYARWVNDAYWLAMPLKVLDPGVHTEKLETRREGGKDYEVLKISFDQVGLTPGDEYHLYVDPETHRVEFWEMLLEGKKDQPVLVSWEGYKRVGPLWLAHEHRVKGAERRIYFEDVEVLDHVQPQDFEKPTPAG